MKRLWIVALGLLASGVPVQAASVLGPFLGSPGDCYARVYDTAHLASHPRQMVESIFLTYDTDFQDPNAELSLFIGITTRDGKSYEATGICNGDVCSVEGDGGRFKLRPDRTGLRLEVDSRLGMRAEGVDGPLALEATDDTVFVLHKKSPRACN